MEVHSYCKMHDTYPQADEPCWQCIRKFEENNTLKQERDDLRDNLQAIVDDATEQVKSGMVSFKQTSVLIKLKLIANAKAEIAKCEDTPAETSQAS